MRVLYGVQGTGNGHITRARALLHALQQEGVAVNVLISGRARSALFGVEPLGDFQWREGFSFEMSQGRIRPWQTLRKLKLKTFVSDVSSLCLDGYDLVLSDFEPVTAWAAKRRGVRCIGVGHQYAFRSAIPTKGINIPSRLVMRYFAPADISVGLHWHPFNPTLLPPMLEPLPTPPSALSNTQLVYLPFEATEDLIRLLAPMTQTRFNLYADVKAPFQEGAVHVKPFSRDGFKVDLLHCQGVITGAGFELPSEALVLGKKLLVRPLLAQLEQESNALALQKMGRARVMQSLCAQTVLAFLADPLPQPVHYPNVAQRFAQWLSQGAQEPLEGLALKTWKDATGLAQLSPVGTQQVPVSA